MHRIKGQKIKIKKIVFHKRCLKFTSSAGTEMCSVLREE